VNSQWTVSEQSVSSQWTVSEQSVNSQWTISEQSVNSQWIISEQSVNNRLSTTILQTLENHFVGFLVGFGVATLIVVLRNYERFQRLGHFDTRTTFPLHQSLFVRHYWRHFATVVWARRTNSTPDFVGEQSVSNQWVISEQPVNNQWTVSEQSVNMRARMTNSTPDFVGEQLVSSQWTTSEQSVNSQWTVIQHESETDKLHPWILRCLTDTPAAIVNVGSKQGITCPPGNTAYNVSKAGVKILTEGLQHELRGKPDCQLSAFLLIPGEMSRQLAMALVATCSSASFLTQVPWNFVEFSWNFCGTFVELLWNFHPPFYNEASALSFWSVLECTANLDGHSSLEDVQLFAKTHTHNTDTFKLVLYYLNIRNGTFIGCVFRV
jgi:hypothetical protein